MSDQNDENQTINQNYDFSEETQQPENQENEEKANNEELDFDPVLINEDEDEGGSIKREENATHEEENVAHEENQTNEENVANVENVTNEEENITPKANLTYKENVQGDDSDMDEPPNVIYEQEWAKPKKTQILYNMDLDVAIPPSLPPQAQEESAAVPESQSAEQKEEVKREKPNFVIPEGAKEVVELQKKLNKIESLTLDATYFYIIKNFNNPRRYECLAQTLNLYSTLRFKRQNEYAELASRLTQALVGFDEVLLQESHGMLLRRLYDRGIFSKEQIAEKCDHKASQYIYFANVLRISQRGEKAKPVQTLMRNLNYLAKNDWRLYIDNLYGGFDHASIQYTIEDGNLELLRKYTGHPRFNIEQKYSDSPYCPFGEYSEFFFPERLKYSLLAVAAFYASVGCFKFLLTFNPVISEEVCKCAIRGGNLDIVKMCIDRGGRFEDLKGVAIAAHQNDIYDYLNEHFQGPKPSLQLISASGNLLAAFMYINGGGDLSNQLENETTALHEAVKKENEFMTKILVENGVSVDCVNAHGDSPLHVASGKASSIIVEYLLNKGCDVNLRDNNGWTPLHFAAKSCNKKIAQILIDAGADINAKTLSGYTVLHISIINNNMDLPKVLLEKGANPNSFNKEDKSPLCLAILKRQTGLAKMLIEHGADVNTSFDKESPILVAYKERNEEMIQYLLAHGARDLPKNLEDGTMETEEITSLTLPPSYDIKAKDQFGRTLLMLACQTGQFDIVKKLVSEFANLNDKDCNGFTPLMIAIKYGHEDIALFLIRSGAILDTKAKNDRTALHLAVQQNMIEVVKAMRSKGAYMSPSTPHVKTPLSLAVTDEMKKLIQMYGGV